MAGKYLRILKTEFSNLKEYKIEFITHYLGIPGQIAMLYFLWYLIFTLSGQEMMGGMIFSEFIFYIGMAAFIGNALPTWETSEKISEFIRNGNVLMIITKPIRFIPLYYIREGANFLTFGLFGVTIFGIISKIMGWFVPELKNVLLFALSLVLGMSLQFFVIFSVAMLSFFIYAIWGIRSLEDSLRYFFSGEMIPLSLFPPWLMQIASFLPYKYVLFVPLFIYMGKFSTSEALLMILYQILFIIFFIIICSVLFAFGVKRTDSHGG